MKNIFKALRNKVTLFAVLTIALLGIAGAVSIASFGPDRPIKKYVQGQKGFDYVTFNSFTDVPNIGDERNFVTGKINNAPDGFYDPMYQVRDGNEILVRVYVHNNADASLNSAENGAKGVAKNTKVRAEIPTGLATAQQAKAYITADNAQPKSIYDTLDVTANYPIELDYVEGSAHLDSNFVNDLPLSDDIVKGGVLIGDDKLDGNIPGCFEYVALVTFKVKVKASNYNVAKTVRLEGEDKTKWREQAEVQPAGTVEWKLEFKNTGAAQLNNVDIYDQLPAKMTLVPGSTMIYNTKFPSGVNAGTDNIIKNGIDVGDYAPASNVIVVFKAKVPSMNELACGVNTFVNKGFAIPEGQAAVTDNASVTVNKNCVTPTYSCDLLTATKVGTGREYKFTANASNAGGATIQRYVFTFGDGQTRTVTNNSLNYTYAADGRYNANVKVDVLVNGQTVTVGGNGGCAVQLNVDTAVPAYACDMLTAEKLNGRTVRFNAKASATNGATIQNYTYNFGDGSAVLTSTNDLVTYTYEKDGSYKPEVKVNVLVNGQTVSVSGANCVANLEFSTVNPTYSCDLVTIEKTGERNVKVKAKASANNGATIKRYVYNFGDGSAELTTDKTEVTHTYAKDGQYAVRVKVQIGIGNETVTAESNACAAAVTFASTPTTPVTPTTPGKLPEAGAGSVIATFLAVTGVSTLGYYLLARRSARI